MSMEDIVLGVIVEEAGQSGITAQDIARILRYDPGKITPRLAPLERQGLIERAQEKKLLPSGRKATAWKPAAQTRACTTH